MVCCVIFDVFLAPYKPGISAPPHLSPFVDNEREGYVPRQRKVLDKWAKGEVYKSDDEIDNENDDK